jgi:hypothetical protein
MCFLTEDNNYVGWKHLANILIDFYSKILLTNSFLHKARTSFLTGSRIFLEFGKEM